jgi:hypothetical protein
VGGRLAVQSGTFEKEFTDQGKPKVETGRLHPARGAGWRRDLAHPPARRDRGPDRRCPGRTVACRVSTLGRVRGDRNCPAVRIRTMGLLLSEVASRAGLTLLPTL